jgi:uncharacterized repeat protein (TIGR03803 family)
VKAFVRFALAGAIAALLAACGGSQPPVGAPAAMPQSRAGTGYTVLYSFGKRYSGGQEPKAGLMDLNGTLYGTTYAGGSTACVGGCGVVFKITPSGKEAVLHRFEGGNDGSNPSASLLAVKGVLYGTTEYGGIPSYGGCNAGTVFSVSTLGVEKVVYRFYGYYCNDHVYNDGGNPVASLIDVSGNLYGTTSSGGAGEFYGTAFEVSTSGTEQVLYSFGYASGANPVAGLADVAGTLYGTTEQGGAYTDSSGTCCGVAFSLSTTGTEKVLDDFVPGPNGASPTASLIDVKGNLYGTTVGSGAYYGGTAFSITTNGSLTLLHSFGSGTDGSYPWAPLLVVKGALYGTTSAGGAYGKGTIFRLSLNGNREKVLHSFGYGFDGATPLAGLIDVKGTLYGTTSAGGAYGNGTVFALALQPHGERGQ